MKTQVVTIDHQNYKITGYVGNTTSEALKLKSLMRAKTIAKYSNNYTTVMWEN